MNYLCNLDITKNFETIIILRIRIANCISSMNAWRSRKFFEEIQADSNNSISIILWKFSIPTRYYSSEGDEEMQRTSPTKEAFPMSFSIAENFVDPKLSGNAKI